MPSRCMARFVRPLLEQRFRGADGILQLSPDSCARLVIEHIPIDNLADAGRSIDPPLRIAWRVGDDGLLIHGNHYHPFLLRPKAFDHPLRLSIDPVDSRFIDRTSLDDGRIDYRPGHEHRVPGRRRRSDSRCFAGRRRGAIGAALRALAMGILGEIARQAVPFAAALWLVETPRGVAARGGGAPPPWWTPSSAEAARLEEANRARKSWRL